MKSLIFFIFLIILTSISWVTSGFWRFSRENYLNEKTLEISVPISVTIDTVFLSKLEPANE